MSSKFLTTSSNDISDGTAVIYGAVIGATNLTAGLPVKVDANRILQSQKLEISDVNNLQNELDNVISNPLTSNLDFDGNNIIDMNSLEVTKQASQPASTAGTLKLYANNSGEFHQVDENGIDSVVGGEIYNQSLNDFDDVEFKSVTLGGYQLLDGVDGFEIKNNVNNKISYGTTVASIESLDVIRFAGDSLPTSIAGIKSRGTAASPAFANAGDNFLSVASATWAGGAPDNFRFVGGFGSVASENHSATQAGAFYCIRMVPSGTTQFKDWFQLKDDKMVIGDIQGGTTYYELPVIRATTANQVLKDVLGNGVTTWEDDGHSFDQELNTTNDVIFNTCKTSGKITIGTATPATEWQLTNVRGINGQALYTTGSQSYWGDTSDADVRYITSPLYGQTDITGLLSISQLPPGPVETSNTANYTITSLMASLRTFGFTFTFLELTEITDIAVDITLLVGGGTRPFIIYRDSDQAVMGSYNIDTADPIVDGRYKQAITPLLLPADNYRVGVDLNSGDNYSTTTFVGTINSKLGSVFGCRSVNGVHGYPASNITLNRPEAGILYFRQPAGVDPQISVEKIAVAEVDNVGGQLIMGLNSDGIELSKPGAQTLVRSTFRTLQQADINGGLSIGVTQGVNDYHMPLTRGDYCDIMKIDSLGNVIWTRHGNYSKTDTTVVSNTLVKTSIAGVGVGSLVIPAWNLGDCYHVKTSGVVDSEGKSEDVTITLELDGVIIWSSDFVDLDDLKTDVAWEVETDFTIKSLGVGGDVFSNGQMIYSKDNDSSGWRGLNSQYEANVDTTASHTLQIFAQWTNAKVGNIFTCKQIVVTKTF